MFDWNVVVTVHDGHFNQAKQFMEAFGQPCKTDYFNVIVMKVDDVEQFLEDMNKEMKAAPYMESIISRVMPASITFNFQVPDEFKKQTMEAIESWVPKLAGKCYHVRMHRRGFKGRLSSHDEEHELADFLMMKLAEQGAAARIDFDDPDYIIDIETVGQWTGVALWTREQRLRYPFLKLD